MFDGIKAKCAACPLKKKKNLKEFPVIFESKTSFESKNGGDVLVYLDQPITKSPRELERLKNAFTKHYGLNCDFIYGVECEVNSLKMPPALYSTYANCNTRNHVNFGDYKVIITIGRALYSITHSDDLPNWQEFVEFQFNQTYFYTPLRTPRVRVYPLPSLEEFFGKDNFENKIYVKHQLAEVKKYLAGEIDSQQVAAFNYEICEDSSKFLLDNMEGDEIWAFDTETRGLNPYVENPAIKCISLTKDGVNAYYLRFMNTETGEILIDVELLSQFLKVKKQLWANGKFDCKWLQAFNVQNCRVDEDVILMFHFLSTERTRNSIKSNGWLIGFGGYEKKLDDLKSKLKIKEDYTKIPEEPLSEYACIDVIVTFRLYILGLELSKLQPTVHKVYKEALDVIPAFLQMEMRGVDLNFDYINKLNARLLIKMRRIATRLKKNLKLADANDVNSPEKLGKAIEKLGWPNLGRNLKGIYTTSDTELKEWQVRGKLDAKLLIEYRKVSKLQQVFFGTTETKVETSMFGEEFEVDEKEEGLIKYVCADNKIHPGYAVAMADTARTKHSSPNVAAFPAKGKEGKLFKPAIGCPDDYYILNMDVAGFQLRLGAIYSKDVNMERAFKELGGDIHSMTCRNLFARDMTIEEFLKVKKEEPYNTQRVKSKRVNFALEFGAIPKTLIENLKEDWVYADVEDYLKKNDLVIMPDPVKMPIEERAWLTVATHIRSQFFELYFGLEAWHTEQRATAVNQGYVDTIGGYRRHLPFLLYKGKNEDNKRFFGLLNICLNSPIQSEESLIMYRSMTKCYKLMQEKAKKSTMMSMIHDYVGFYVHKDEIEVMFEIVSSSFEDFTTYNIPIEIDMSIGKIWESGEKFTKDNYKEIARRLKSA